MKGEKHGCLKVIQCEPKNDVLWSTEKRVGVKGGHSVQATDAFQRVQQDVIAPASSGKK